MFHTLLHETPRRPNTTKFYTRTHSLNKHSNHNFSIKYTNIFQKAVLIVIGLFLHLVSFVEIKQLYKSLHFRRGKYFGYTTVEIVTSIIIVISNY